MPPVVTVLVEEELVASRRDHVLGDHLQTAAVPCKYTTQPTSTNTYTVYAAIREITSMM